MKNNNERFVINQLKFSILFKFNVTFVARNIPEDICIRSFVIKYIKMLKRY